MGRGRRLLYDIGDRVYEIRKQRLMSQSELAKTAGISVATLSRIENGKNKASVGTIKKLADALGVAPQTLIERDSPPTTT